MVLVRAVAVEEPRDIASIDNHNISFVLHSEITSKTIAPLVEQIKDINSNTKLNLYLNSCGGIVPVAIGVFNFIKSIKNLEITTYNMGHCDSAAILLYMLGNYRYVTRNASFRLHSLQINFKQPQTIKSLEQELLLLKEDTNTLINLLAENSNIPKKEWKSLMSDKGNLIRAKKAIKMGLADFVL